MVYQEQVMRVAQVVGGYSLGGADLLRRAMGKKNVEEMKRQRAVFIKGAGERGVKESVATEIFDLMEKFAGYGLISRTPQLILMSHTRRHISRFITQRHSLLPTCAW